MCVNGLHLVCRLSQRRHVRPFSQYGDQRHKAGHTEKENYGFAADKVDKADNKALVNGHADAGQVSWYRDVIELRKKAGEYKVIVIKVIHLHRL